MYNPKDIVFVGKHDYDKSTAEAWAESPTTETFSVGIFQWVLKSNGKAMKRSAVKIRVRGPVSSKEKVFETAEKIVALLDEGRPFNKKTYTVR